MKIAEIIKETATTGATSSSDVSIGNATYPNKKASRKGKNPDGTKKNAIDSNVNLFTGECLKR
jgi:hypothetical protein